MEEEGRCLPLLRGQRWYVPCAGSCVTPLLIPFIAGVIVNPKGEMKGSAIAGPVAKECVRCPVQLFSSSLTDLLTRRLISGHESPPTPELSFKVLDSRRSGEGIGKRGWTS
jgi:hypothetical protein